MIDTIKYFPLKLRTLGSKCTPKGPTFYNAKKINFSHADNLFFFSAPKHRPEIKSTRAYSVDATNIKNITYNRLASSNAWEETDIFFREWAFWGPWFSGAQADLSMHIAAYRLNKADDGTTLFHPKYFENCLADLLNNLYGYRTNNKEEALFHGPIDWQALSTLPVHAAAFNINPIEPKIFAPYRKCIVFPISSETLIFMRLSTSINKPGLLKEKLNHVDISELEQLREAIISSLNITFTPNTQANLSRIKSETPDIKLTKTFAPLKWPVSTSKKKDGPRPNIQEIGNWG